MKKYFLSTLLLILLLVYSIQCVDLYKIRRVPQQDQELTTYNSNHPPSVETYVPVSVMYDDEDISTQIKSIKPVVSASTEDEKSSENINENGDSESVTEADEYYGNYSPIEEKNISTPSEIKSNNKESQTVSSIESEYNESLSVDLDQSTEVKKIDDSKSIIKPKGRSLTYESPDSTVEIEPSTTENNIRVRKQRRRLQRVNKKRVNKIMTTVDQNSGVMREDNNEAEIQSRKIDETNKNNDQATTTTPRRIQQRVYKETINRTPSTDNGLVGETQSQNNQTEIKPRKSNLQTTTAANLRRRTQQRVNKEIDNKNTPTGIEKPTQTQIGSSQTEIKSRKIDEPRENNDQAVTNTKFQKRTQQHKTFVPIVESENYVFAHQGDFHYSYEGGDGTKAFERGELKSTDGASSGTGVVGGFSYTDEDGNDFSLTYTADENGYRPIGAHLPTPPPIPIEIQRALAILATKTTPEPITERIKPY